MIHILKALSDNYIYLIELDEGYIVIDPGEAKPVCDFLKKGHKKLLAIWITHHHSDHIGGVEKLLEEKPKIFAPNGTFEFPIDYELVEGKHSFCGLDFEVIKTPGHTLDHVVIYVSALKALFSGDTLFGGGCGKLFEGSPEQMQVSLEKIKSLPKETNIYFGHEYTIKNLEFALSVDPGNELLQKRLEETRKAKISSPSTLEIELLTNPYLRLNDREIRAHLNLKEVSPSEVLGKIRALKDSY